MKRTIILYSLFFYSLLPKVLNSFPSRSVTDKKCMAKVTQYVDLKPVTPLFLSSSLFFKAILKGSICSLSEIDHILSHIPAENGLLQTTAFLWLNVVSLTDHAM